MAFSGSLNHKSFLLSSECAGAPFFPGRPRAPSTPTTPAIEKPRRRKWSVRCAKIHHSGDITAAVAELAVKTLRCAACGHRQPFAPELVQSPPRRRRHDRRAVAARQVLATMQPGDFDDRVDDLWAAGSDRRHDPPQG